MITIFQTNSMKNAAEYITDVLTQVKRSQGGDLSVMHTVIVPDRASLEAERALLKAVKGSFNIQVRTFRRLANEVLPKFDYLSKQAGIMALTGIIQDVKDQLVCYKKGVETSGFVSDMYDTISMMKYCCITPEQLQRPDLPQSVAGKAHDIALLYRAYLDYTANRFIDSADKLNLLCEQIAHSDSIKHSYFYLYDFDNFTAQELALVEKLQKYALGVTVSCCTSAKKQDKYLYDNAIFSGLQRMCQRAGVIPNIITDSGNKYNNKYTRQIGENLYRYNEVVPLEAEGFVETYKGSTRVQEVYALACRVQKFVREGGRFKDIYVVTSDINKYSNAIATVFDEFDIPYFCDRQFALNDHPYSRFVLDYLTLCRYNARLDYVLPFVKNYLFCGSLDGSARVDEDVFRFENYCLKYNVSYEYDYFRLGKNEPYFANADAFREKFSALRKNVTFAPSGKAVDYIADVRRLIQEVNLNEKNAAFADEQESSGFNFESKVTRQAQQKFEEVLFQAERVFGERYVKLEDFIKLLTVAVSSVKISVIPVNNDCVVFANMAKARKHDIKFLALLGANFGAMPIVKRDCKLLSDKNLETLAEYLQTFANSLDNSRLEQTVVGQQIFAENKRERFSLFQLLLEPTEKLYVSYTATDGGDSLSPSQFVTELHNLFSVNGSQLDDTETTDEEVYTVKQALAKVILNKRKQKDNQPINMPAYNILLEELGGEAEQYEYNNDGEVSVRNGKEFYLDNSETSVSKLTDFYKCPYRFYLEYGLRIKPRTVAELQASDLGDILHSVLENFVRDLDKTESAESTIKRAEKCFTDATSGDFFRGLRNDAQLSGILEQLKTESVRMCQVVKQQLANSQFVNRATELSFGGNTGTVPPVEVDYGEGKFLLIGKIDRVDVDGDRFVVIDYKSGSAAAHFTEKDLYVGHKLQLLVYVKAVQNAFGYVPVGFYYFGMHNKFVDETAKSEYVYNGRTLNDVDTAAKLDTQLKLRGKSEKLGLQLKADGSFDGSVCRNKLLSADQFDDYTEYAVQMIKQAGQLMLKGYASVNPYEGVCSYCDYQDICDFNDVLVHDKRKVSDTVKPDTIKQAVKKCSN